jgi:hypothetical protein
MHPLTILALAACAEPDTDGPRWDPTPGTWFGTSGDTGSFATTTDTLVQDTAPPAPTGDTGGPTTDAQCDGSGAVSLRLGHGGRTTFDEYGAGEDLPIVTGPSSGAWGVTLEVLTTGLDTSEPVSAVMRVITASADTTYIGVLMLQCPTPGPGWVALHADFPDEDQSQAAAGAYDGDVADVLLTLTDHTNEYASTSVQLVLTGP